MTDYKAQYQIMHQDVSVFSGGTIKLYLNDIQKLINEFNASSILDYGCGKGHQYTKDHIHKSYFNGVMPALYDIGVPEFETIPEGTFDAVISTDVLEHIPEDQLGHVLTEIYSKATKFVFFAIHEHLAGKNLPNGENTHCTVHPIEWWVDLISNYATSHTVIMANNQSKQWII
jgi:cyclopropane fatty-acyl-phospholipid synthase-like methyltransferase